MLSFFYIYLFTTKLAQDTTPDRRQGNVDRLQTNVRVATDSVFSLI